MSEGNGLPLIGAYARCEGRHDIQSEWQSPHLSVNPLKAGQEGINSTSVNRAYAYFRPYNVSFSEYSIVVSIVGLLPALRRYGQHDLYTRTPNIPGPVFGL